MVVKESGSDLRIRLTNVSNLTESDIERSGPWLIEQVKELCRLALDYLRSSDITERSVACPELNAIYRIYRNKIYKDPLEKFTKWCAWTHSSKLPGRFQSDPRGRWLSNRHCHVASGLRTSSTMEFSEGTKKLIHWC